MDQDDIGVTLQQSLRKTGSCYKGDPTGVKL